MSLIMSRFLKTIESSFDFRGTKTIPQAERRISFLRGGSKAEHSGIFFSLIKTVQNVNRFRCLVYGFASSGTLSYSGLFDWVLKHTTTDFVIWYLNCFQFKNGTSNTCRREHGTYRDINTTSNRIEGQDMFNITNSLNISSYYTTTE